MNDETESLTIRLLQESRAQNERTTARIDELSEHFTDLTQRIDGKTLVFNPVAGVVHDHEDRIGTLERGRP